MGSISGVLCAITMRQKVARAAVLLSELPGSNSCCNAVKQGLNNDASDNIKAILQKYCVYDDVSVPLLYCIYSVNGYLHETRHCCARRVGRDKSDPYSAAGAG